MLPLASVFFETLDNNLFKQKPAIFFIQIYWNILYDLFSATDFFGEISIAGEMQTFFNEQNYSKQAIW